MKFSSIMGTKIDAGDIAKPFREEVKTRVAQLKESGIGKYVSFIIL